MVKKKLIAIIPARGGSKRIPKKNIVDFFSKPIIAHTIIACKQAGIFDRIIVSTDCSEIAEISKENGAEVPFLRESFSDDHTPVSKATLHSLQQAEKHYAERYEYVAQLMPNCPIRNAEDIKNAYNNFLDKDLASQISCFKFGFMNPWWALKLDKDFNGKRLLENTQGLRSQDLEELYCPTGAIWLSKKSHLEKYESFYGEHKFFELNWKSAVDIDNYEDLELAKAVFLMINK